MTGEVVSSPHDPIQEAERRYKESMVRYRQPYRLMCLPDAEWQRCKLEALRYKWRYHVTDTRFMQVLGNVCRRWLS